MGYLWASGVLLKDFGGWADDLTARVRAASERAMVEAGRPVVYLPGPSVSKEEWPARSPGGTGSTEGRCAC